jgi:protein phosphatase
MKLTTGKRIDIGRVRDNNEDAGLNTDRLIAVADGMGGAPSGEVAATVAISLVDAAFSGESLDELRAAVAAANRAIWDRANSDAGLEGMGSTICAVGLTAAGSLAVVNVGDSRAYLFHDGELRQLTRDHTVTAALVERGEITESEALDHPHRNVLTRVLGGGPNVEADAATFAAVEGDRILVCSDGLFNEVSTDEISAVLASTQDLQAAADALIESALSSGARDNVSAVLAEVGR